MTDVKAVSARARRFLSLKWKALLLSSLVLIAITGMLSGLSYLSLVNQFERQRQVTYRHNVEQIAALIEQSSRRLQQIGSILSLLAGMRSSILAADGERINHTLDRNGSMLQIDMGIDVIRIYDQASRPVGNWGTERLEVDQKDLPIDWVRRVNKKEYPETYLACNRDCMQYAILPMLVDGETRGVALVGASLAEMMLVFHQALGMDIALLAIGNDGREDEDDASRLISPWRARVIASTNADSIVPLLHAVARPHVDIDEVERGSRVLFQKRHYEVSLTSLPGFTRSIRTRLVMVDDITSSLAQIDGVIRQHLTIGALGLVFSEALLLGLLWAPMSHLRRTALTLPLLAEDAFEQVRGAITKRARRFWPVDEVDVLEDVAVSLASRLEALKAGIEHRSRVLRELHGQLEIRVQERTQELSRANELLHVEVDTRRQVEHALAEQAEDLKRSEQSLRSQTKILQSILNSMADGVIVADQNGELLLSNPAAQSLSGYDLTRLTFNRQPERASFFLPDAVTPYASDALPLSRALRGEEVDGAEGYLCDRDGSKGVWLSANARPLKDHEGVSGGAVVVLRDISERKLSEQRLAQLAQYDTLTGLPNRNLLHDRLNHAIVRARRGPRLMALMFLDVDRFKEINDALGHNVGDLVLKGIAERLTQCLRESDTIGRLGGDEFTVILEEIDGAEHAGLVAEKIIAAFSRPLLVEDRELLISTSVGIALYPTDADTLEDLLKRADTAMYHAKKQGRNNYQFYTAQMNADAYKRMTMTSRLRRALEQETLTVCYQPQVDIHSERIIGAEALLRWHDAEFGVIPPVQFIALAEETGLIVPLGEWVLDVAAKQNKAWQDEGLGLFPVAVNLSTRQLRQAQLTQTVARILRTSRLEPRYLGLEITEGLLMEDLQLSRQLLSELKAMGIQISIDDFGTGYSSLSYLKHFPLDVIKIDRCFVQHITSDKIDAAIAAAIITLGKSLGLTVIAEGVETEQQLTLLRAHDCDVVQGFLFSRARPAAEFTALLRKQAELDAPKQTVGGQHVGGRWKTPRRFPDA